MLNVVEMFSGIGSQAKALTNSELDFSILATCDWDINAIIAYDIIHYGEQDLTDYIEMTDDELCEQVEGLAISMNGKIPMSNDAKRKMKRDVKERLLAAIDRTENLIDITEVRGVDIPDDCNVLTYSFPCQDLSNAGFWQGNEGGIDRDANNRSSLLWQVERILIERHECKVEMPRFLLMENVSAIQSTRNRDNFEEWKNILRDLGYANKVMNLDASNFGLPQKRKRTFMISVYHGGNENLENIIDENFNLIEEGEFHNGFDFQRTQMIDILRTNYENEIYLDEALMSNPNNTPSRIRIGERTPFIDETTEFVPTVTTKQDRFPNSGLIDFQEAPRGKAHFRYLTPRENFLLMGFSEEDMDALLDNNFNAGRSNFFTRDKLNKMAGNSICVNVLMAIFEYINDLNDMIEMAM